jgi:hypothetical protein
MSTLVDVATYLDAQLATLTLGTNLFVGRMPDSPDTCVALYEYGGAVPTNTMGTATPTLESPRIQVSVRASAYSDAETLIDSIWTQLEGIVDETLTSTRYNRVSAVQSPFPLERDTADRIVFVQNFQVVKAYA